MPARVAASNTELVVLEGDSAELIGPNSDVQPTPVLPGISSFLLLDGGDGGLRADGTFGANATLLLTFNVSAHDPVGAVWRHEDIRGFDIPMNDLLRMSISNRITGLAQDVDQAPQIFILF